MTLEPKGTKINTAHRQVGKQSLSAMNTNSPQATRPVYLDCAATTAMDPRVADLTLRLMTEDFGNAGSRTHLYGAVAKAEVLLARERVAAPLAAAPEDVIFTSGATESNNLAILGLERWGLSEHRRHIVSTAIEHKAVLECLDYLGTKGFEITLISPDTGGYISAEELLKAIRSDTLLVSVMHANNETGTIQPISEVADGLLEHPSVLFHVDAAQTFGKESETLAHPRVDLVSISGHKIFGPKGVGALVAKRRMGKRPPLAPLLFGGGQERGLRPGTLPVPLIAGLGLATELAEREREVRREACLAQRTAALAAFSTLNATVHGDPERGVLPNIFSVAVPGLDSEAIIVATKHLIAISNGSACTSARYEPSHVLSAMSLGSDVISGTVRLSWSHTTGYVPWEKIIEALDELRI